MKLLWFMVVALGMAWGQGWLESILLPSKQAVATVCNKAIANARLGQPTLRNGYRIYMSDPDSLDRFALSPLGAAYSMCAIYGGTSYPPLLNVTIGGFESEEFVAKQKVEAVFYDDSGRVLGRLQPNKTYVAPSWSWADWCPTCPTVYNGNYEFDPTKRADIIRKATVVKFIFMADGYPQLTLSKKTMPNWR